MRRKGIFLVALLTALALVSAACGSDTGNETGSGDERQSESADDESTSEETDAEETETDEGTGEGGGATYAATEFAFKGPDVMPAGEVTLTMDNQGKQMHELALGELLEGKSLDDVHALLKKGVPKKPPTWFREVGGTGAAPGETGTIDAELIPGTYIMLCFVPDKATKKPHAMLGMMKEVTVE
jgi:hypothetical protein